MKRILPLTIILIVLAGCTFAQSKKALIVGIGKYMPGTGWEELKEIHGNNDIAIIKGMLLNNGFEESNISTLENEQATHKNITYKIEQLVKTCKKDDIIYIHFSCHGQQVTDLNGDEKMINPHAPVVDRLDEAIVPYDAYIDTRNNYKGEKHIIDDYLHEKFELICEKIKPNGKLIFVNDACHSGGSTRGDHGEMARNDAPSRGTSKTLDLPYEKVPQYTGTTKISFVAITACLDNEKSYEYKDPTSQKYYGALSYALKDYKGETLEELGKKINTIYKKLLHNPTPKITNPTSATTLF